MSYEADVDAGEDVFISFDGDTYWLECGCGVLISPIETGDSWRQLYLLVLTHTHAE